MIIIRVLDTYTPPLHLEPGHHRVGDSGVGGGEGASSRYEDG
jgi:hypothetical protein